MPNTDKGQTFEQYLKAIAKLLRTKYRSNLLHELNWQQTYCWRDRFDEKCAIEDAVADYCYYQDEELDSLLQEAIIEFGA
jgi:hypothetical protein